MDQSVEKKLWTILETVQDLNPITVRLILNRNAGQIENEEWLTLFKGTNSTSLQEIDLKIYKIMKNQSQIVIPSVNQSGLLSTLEIENASAIIMPVKTEYGYCGCFWGCFAESKTDDRLVEVFENFNDWISETINAVQKTDFGVEAIAQRYADFLDQQKTPAIIVIYPDQVSISNPSFESLSSKENILQLIRKNIAPEHSFMELVNLYHCAIRDVSFPGGKTGKIFQFLSDNSQNHPISFDTNELDYFELMVNKAIGNLSLLENAGNMNLIQYNYKEKVEAQLRRLFVLIQDGKKHYLNFHNSREGAFAVINIAELVKEVVFDLKTVAKKKNLDIVFNIDREEKSQTQNGKVIGDAWLLSLTVFNLLENAIRYSKPDSKPIRVDLNFGLDSWVLVVQDFGIGISPLDVEKLLNENNEKSPSEDTQAVHGLDFVKYAIKLHKGTFGLESRLGKGTEFKLDVPYY